jgi:hypothetical protein
MLHKMRAYEFAWHENREFISSRPRQVFVTQSSLLVEKVEKQFKKLPGYIGMENVERDSSFPQTYRGENKQLSSNGLDDAAKFRDDLPNKFSELNPGHFPLFITFDKVACPIILLHGT